ncbi:MAG: GAF domain-containing protein [Ignavibacteriae bacterium]|nr:GAF domain-containing protein [Ignavibacteria bacterium]MBI3363724.1 GAF domain-containing protein [Ignavibacteriota bacterium]
MINKPDAFTRGGREMLKAVMPGRLVEGSDILRRMSMLHEVLLHIDSAQSRDDIISVVRSEAKWIVEHDMCLMGLLNRSVTHYAITVISSSVDISDLNHKHFGIEEGMPGWVMRNHSAVIEDIESGPSYSSSIDGRFRALGIKSLLIVPMRIEKQVIGALTFGSKKHGVYSEIDSGLAQLFAHYFATAIRNAAIFEDVRKRISQIEIINEVARKLTSQLNLEELLHVAASSIQKSFSYFDVTVFLLSEDRSEMVLEAHAGNFVDFLPHGYRQKTGDGLIGWVGQHGERVLCNDVSQDTRYLAYEYHNTRSELAIPIKADGVMVGVLNVEDTKLHAFDETDAIVLETLSDQLGVAIRNAKLYDEIRKANMKLTELDTMKSEFLGIVSHDFRSPLSSIILAGKALLKNESVQSVKRVKDYLQIIVDQANRLNQLAEDTLSITKIEAGRLSFHFKIVNFSRLIEDAITMVRVSSRHEIIHTVPPDVSFIKGDQAKLRQVIQNLVNNAIKYSPRGGKVTVAVEEQSPEQILVSVTDEGIGIPPDKIEKLFQKFSRVDSGEANQIKGAGLGLWICREIVEAHGGKIWIESEIGQGSTVKFTLNKAHEENSP